jgi:hypothetical protein
VEKLTNFHSKTIGSEHWLTGLHMLAVGPLIVPIAAARILKQGEIQKPGIHDSEENISGFLR